MHVDLISVIMRKPLGVHYQTKNIFDRTDKDLNYDSRFEINASLEVSKSVGLIKSSTNIFY